MVKVSLIEAGYCTHPQKVAWRDGGWGSIRFPATVAVLEHPNQGVTLLDTGYSEAFFQETRRFPQSIYAQVTPVFLDEKTTARAQLARLGIAPQDVRKIVITHFHADHIGGLKDFPRAQFIFADDGFAAVRKLRGWRALRAAFLPGLLPADFEQRSQPIVTSQWTQLPGELAQYGLKGFDVFGDDQVWIVRLDGHATGHVGLWVRQGTQSLLFLGDACYVRENFEQNTPSMGIARLIFDHFGEYKKTLHCLHQIYTQQSQIELIPCHCEKTTSHWMANHAHR